MKGSLVQTAKQPQFYAQLWNNFYYEIDPRIVSKSLCVAVMSSAMADRLLTWEFIYRRRKNYLLCTCQPTVECVVVTKKNIFLFNTTTKSTAVKHMFKWCNPLLSV